MVFKARAASGSTVMLFVPNELVAAPSNVPELTIQFPENVFVGHETVSVQFVEMVCVIAIVPTPLSRAPSTAFLAVPVPALLSLSVIKAHDGTWTVPAIVLTAAK